MNAKIKAKFLSIDFDEKTITFALAPEDVARFRWHAGEVELDVSTITAPEEAEGDAQP